MFTGIIEQVSRITGIVETTPGAIRLTVQRPIAFATEPGDSVAVNGCCLTVAQNPADQMVFDLSSETLAKTAMNQLRVGQIVNLERALAFNGRLGGHIVSGHVDMVGKLSKLNKLDSGWLVAAKFDSEAATLVIPKGSITIDGISLTVNKINDLKDGTEVEVMLIPTTIQKTTMSAANFGQTVNLEFDLVGKYILRSQQVAKS